MNINFDSNAFARALKQKRVIDTKITQSTLSLQLHISVAKLQKLEGGSIPGLMEYFKICKWLAVSADKFIINEN